MRPLPKNRSRENSFRLGDATYLFHEAGSGNPEIDNAVKLIARWLPEDITGSVALIECGQGYLARIASSRSAQISSYHSSWIDYTFAEKNKTPGNRFSDFSRYAEDNRFDLILFRNTKSATHNLNIISHALNALAPGGKLFIAGGNRDGIKGLAAKLGRRGVDTEKVANGKGSRILECDSSVSFESEEETLETLYSLEQSPITIKTVPGLFSHGKPDRGTLLLLSHIPNCKDKSVLDLGCGSGVLGLSALRSGATSVTATDISAMALQAAEINLAGFENKSIKPSYLGDSLDQRFDIILTNPPFHEGKATRYTLGEEWLDNCRRRLKKRGALWLVANEFLNYRRWGEERFSSVDIVETRDRFTVYRMTQ